MADGKVNAPTGKPIDVAGLLNAATTEGWLAKAIQTYYGGKDKSVEEELDDIEKRCYLIENEEYLWALVDAKSVILGGVKRKGGEWYIPVGTSDDMVSLFKSLQKQIDDMVSYRDNIYHIIENDTYLLAIMDKNENCLGGITKSGRWVIPDGISDEAQRHIDDIRKILAKVSDTLDNEIVERKGIIRTDTGSYAWAIADKNENVWLAGLKDGTVLMPCGIPEEVKPLLKDAFQRLERLESFIKTAENLGVLGAFIDNFNNTLCQIWRNGDFEIVNKLKTQTGMSISVEETEADTLYHIVDKDGLVLFNIKRNGQLVGSNGIILDGLKSGISFVDSQKWLFAVVDNNKNILGGIDKNGATFANSISGVFEANVIEDYNYLLVFRDFNGNILFGVRKDGSFFANSVVIDGIPTTEENPTFLYVILDKNRKVLWGIMRSGTVYQPKGIPEEVREHLDKLNKQLSAFEEQISNFHGGTGDWSESTYIELPIPRLAHINLITDRMPTAKSGMGTIGVNCDIECRLEYFDHEGNYFKKKILLSAQGNSSMAFIKKNLAIDIFNDIKADDTFTIKFGDWVGQDSFHLKAYYTDTFRGRGAVSYMLYEQMVNTRPVNDRRPFQQMFVDKTSINNEGYDCNTELNENFETGAKCFPMGFPCIVYQNGEFYGVYAFQLKKHRDNMWQNKKTAEHVHIDGTLGAASIFGGTIDWTQFEVRNPKSLYYQATALEDFPVSVQNAIKQGRVAFDEDKGMYEYNGDYPAEIATKKYNCKKYIEALSKYCGELSALESDLSAQVSAGTITQDSMNATMREEIANRFYVSFMIDYILEVNLVRDGDGWNKNWQWATWDGIHWTANPYDHDGIFGGFHIGVYQGGASSGSQGTSKTIPSGWIWAYYLDELKARWAELRNANIFNADNIIGLLKDWVDRVGYDNWKREFERWPETPCNRDSHVNTSYWKRSGGYFSNATLDKGTWKSDTAYEKNQYASTYEAVEVEKPDGTTKKVNKRTIWQALVANTDVDPLTDDGTTWKRISWDANKTYAKNETCYYGCSTLYQMKSQVDDNLGNEPITKFYSEYPYELGCYDNIYRVYAWLKKTIEYIDKTFEYQGQA